MSTTTNVLLAIRAAHRPAEPRARNTDSSATTRSLGPELRATHGESGGTATENHTTFKPPQMVKTAIDAGSAGGFLPGQRVPAQHMPAVAHAGQQPAGSSPHLPIA